jgi:hypothetical protein
MAEYELEPWPGYLKQDENQRLDTLEHKVGEARRRGDLLYALAICVAVANHEAVKRGDGNVETIEETAASLARKIHEYGDTHLKDAGGWTPN